MSALLLALAGAGLSSALPTRDLLVETSERFQGAMGRLDHSVRALYELSVDPSSRTYACRVVESDDDTGRVEKACKRMTGLKAFAAKGADGQAAYGIVLVPMRYSSVEIERRESAGKPTFDRTVFASVADMPENIGDPYRVSVNIAIDARGALQGCEARSEDSDARFVKAACELVSQEKLRILANAKGDPVPHVEDRQFLFGTDGAKQPDPVQERLN